MAKLCALDHKNDEREANLSLVLTMVQLVNSLIIS